MNKKVFVIGLLVALVAPMVVSAHAHYNYEINGDIYAFTIGSLNEPISVDDRTGVELRVNRLEKAMMTEDLQEEGVPVTGLEQTLKVEVSAGGQKKVFDLTPAYGAPGSYYAKFYPTVQTTYSYRVFGTIDGTPFEFSAPCTPAGHARATEDTTRVPIADGVVRVVQSGGFGCPIAKASLQFPEVVGSSADLAALVSAHERKIRLLSTLFYTTGLGFGVLAFLTIYLVHRHRYEDESDSASTPIH